MYGLTDYGKTFLDDLNNCLIDESGFKQSYCQMSIYYKCEPYGSMLFLLSYFDDCVYWYTSEELRKWFVDTLGKIFHVKFLGYAHWFMSIKTSQLKDHYISVDQAIYATSNVAKYPYISTIKEN